MNARPSLLADKTIIALNPADIDTSGRVGFYWPIKAAALGRLMAVHGQRDPIKVEKTKPGSKFPWRLVVGRHRVGGALIEGLPVYAIDVTGKPEELKDMESSENMDRRELGPIERARFTAALVQAAQEQYARQNGNLKQQQMAIRARWARVRSGEARAEQALQEEADDTADTMSAVYGWQGDVAEALGRDKRTIRRDLMLSRLVIEPFPDLIEALARHPVVGENAAQLKKIADVKDEAARRLVIEQLLADDEIGADDARISAGVDRPAGPAPAQHQKFYDQIEGGWSRLGIGQKRQFLPKLAAMLNTAELKRAMRDRLNEELGEAA